MIPGSRAFGIAEGSRVRLHNLVGTVRKIASNREDINVLWDGDPLHKGDAGQWHFVSAIRLA